MEIFLTGLAFLYACTGIVATIGYIPTIKDLIKKISSANIASYTVWTFCSFISFLYAMLVISDLVLEIITLLNFLYSFIILILALKLKFENS